MRNNLATDIPLGLMALLVVLGFVVGIIAFDAWIIMLLWGAFYSAFNWPTSTISFGQAFLISIAVFFVVGLLRGTRSS